MTRDHPTVSIVVVTCGAAGVTGRCLASLAGLRFPRLQAIVVNNGGPSPLEACLRDWSAGAGKTFQDVQVLRNETRCGACTARNQALARAAGDYVAFLDNDTLTYDPHWLGSAVELLGLWPDAGIAGPRIIQADPPRRLEAAGYAISPRGQVISLGAGADPLDPTWRDRREVQAVGNFVARTDALRAAGGFDPAFDPFGFENVDCCYRLKRLGLRVLCDGCSDLHHVGHTTTGRFPGAGRGILFEKSLLLRKRWRAAFAREAALFERLTAPGCPRCHPEGVP